MEKWKPNDEQHQVLLKLKQASQPNEAEFAKDFTVYSPSAWSKILAAIDPDRPGSYFDELRNDSGRVKLMLDLEDLLARLPKLRAERQKKIMRDIYPIRPFLACVAAVRQCKGKEGPERIIKVLSSTGGGKTTLRAYLQNEFRGEMNVAAVQCRDSWRPTSTELRYRTKMAVITDLYRAIGLRMTEQRKRGDLVGLEDALLEHLQQQWCVLFIDEAEYFGKYALDLLKLLLNETGKLIVVIACTPRAHGTWNQYYADQADQIARRTHCTISTDEIAPEDAALFFSDKQFAQPVPSLKYIAEEASRFGHYSLIKRVVEILEKSTRAERAEVEDAVMRALKQMAKHRVTSAR